MNYNRIRLSGDTGRWSAILPYFRLTKLSPIPRTNDMGYIITTLPLLEDSNTSAITGTILIAITNLPHLAVDL